MAAAADAATTLFMMCVILELLEVSGGAEMLLFIADEATEFADEAYTLFSVVVAVLTATMDGGTSIATFELEICLICVEPSFMTVVVVLAVVWCSWCTWCSCGCCWLCCCC